MVPFFILFGKYAVKEEILKVQFCEFSKVYLVGAEEEW